MDRVLGESDIADKTNCRPLLIQTNNLLKEEIQDKSISIQINLEALNVIKNCFDQVLKKTKAV